ncbi:MAG: trans-sulfuration enzyme family protein [Candidatus Thalassarchaeaceae archaeon]
MAADDDSGEFATKAVHSGMIEIEGSATTPIFRTSTYRLTDEKYQGWADGLHHTVVYSRISSVNSEVVSAKLAALEGTEDAEVFSSGMAAISTTLMTLLSKGDHIVATPDCYGGTYGLLTEILPRMGIEVTMADVRDPESYQRAIQDNTKVLYVETMTNPTLKVCDLAAMAEVANKNGLVSVVDNTFASPWSCKPVEMGFDIVLHSGTKYLGGHADLTAGFAAGKKDLIEQIFHHKVYFGGAADPQMCYLLERGMRTLHTRMPVHASNSAELARRLSSHEMVEKVIHSSLESHPDHAIAQKIMPKGSGMLAFVIKGGDQSALKFMRSLDIIFEATSLGGVESLVECPFNSSHMFVPEEVRHEAGVVPGFVRMSIGIEDVEDLWNDIDRGLNSAKQMMVELS